MEMTQQADPDKKVTEEEKDDAPPPVRVRPGTPDPRIRMGGDKRVQSPK
jgi:hypothetical protein